MMMIFLIFIINQIYLPLSHSEIQSKNDSPKIIIIRADDISTTNPGIRWLSDVVIERNISATYAVIPDFSRLIGQILLGLLLKAFNT